MRASTYFVLSLLGAAHGLPAFMAEIKRALINLSPVIDLGLDINNDNSCLGIGVSVCDPITVNSTTNSTAVNNNNSKTKLLPTSTSNDDSGDDSLINLSPTISPDINLNNDNSCLGIGISACDPITVNSDVNKSSTNNNNADDDEEDSSSEKSNDTPASSYPTEETKTSDSSTYPTEESKSTPSSNSKSNSGNGDSLLNLSPDASPDINLNNDNSCQGIGISACDPITVNSTTTQISNNSN
ncbi:hypothetical protein F5Y06DRAFT_270833 [Hypoxylon sp. FL0890]|nr:hypothetical protein F5Y06DRAFT_270833 [Hypoxylon sp. FL0890]